MNRPLFDPEHLRIAAELRAKAWRRSRDRRSENPFWAIARLERVLAFGTDQRITSAQAATHRDGGKPGGRIRKTTGCSCTAGSVHTWALPPIRDVWNLKAMPPAQGRHSRCPCLMGNPRRVRQVVRGQPQGGPTCPITAIRTIRCTGMSWGWIAGAVFLVIVLAVALGVGHEPTRVASNNATPPQTTAPAAPPTMPGLTPPPSQAPSRP